jgi:RNA polymerase sigma-70 factor (ECF subfamily)
MTTSSPRMVTESACSTVDSDAHARHGTDSEPRTWFQSDVSLLRESLYRHAMRMTRNPADAEDLLQDTLMNAYASLRSFKQGTNLRGWLFRIMTNAYIDTYRKKLRRPTCWPTGHFNDELVATATLVSSAGSHSLEQQVLDKLGDSEIRAAMCELPEQFRLVVYYADVEGLRFKEIADRMGTSVGTVASRLHRGRRRLRHLLADVAAQHGYPTVEKAA